MIVGRSGVVQDGERETCEQIAKAGSSYESNDTVSS